MTLTPQATPEDRPPLAQIVHRNIEAQLAFAGKKRIDLQMALDVPPMYLQRRYTMGTQWSWDDVERVAKFLNIKVSKLIDRPT